MICICDMCMSGTKMISTCFEVLTHTTGFKYHSTGDSGFQARVMYRKYILSKMVFSIIIIHIFDESNSIVYDFIMYT